MNSYNIQLKKLRESQSLSTRECAKKIGISSIRLYLYEEGYFKPSKKAKKKIEDYFGTSISMEGLDAYPSPISNEIENKVDKKKLFSKRIIFGALSLLMIAFTVTGSVLFTKSVNNVDPYYGEIYVHARENVEIRGTLGHDLVTGLEYYQFERRDEEELGSIIFYKTDNLLYFNETSYSASSFDAQMGKGRYHFIFGGPLGVKSNVCQFSYGSVTNGSYFTCSFKYENGTVKEINDFVIRVQSDVEITEELALGFINSKLGDMEFFLSSVLLSELLGQDVSFYEDFLPSREQGRIVNYYLQIVGLSFIIPGILFFFIFLWIFTRLMVVNIKPRLVVTSGLVENERHKPLPNDINMRVGLPDFVILVVARVLTVSSIFLMILGFISSVGVFSLPSFFHNPNYLSFLKISLLAGIFLNHFIVLGRHKKPDELLKKIIYNLYIFLLFATLETAIIGITNAWGYDFASLIYQYLPGNIFQVVAVQYIIYLFLFFQPPFLNDDKKVMRYIWHGFSLIPLAFLVVSYFVSNSYMLVYGVKENLYINFWFPNGFLPLSMVSTLFMYTSFGFNLYKERKYGIKNSQIYSYGDRYTLIENSICVFYLILVGLFDLLFIHNQYGYYLGLGYNQWIFTLIPFIILMKYSPNKKQTVLLSGELDEISRAIGN